MEWNENTLNRFFWPVDVQERMNIKLPSTPREDFFACIMSGIMAFSQSGLLIAWPAEPERRNWEELNQRQPT
jgi:hypothetical protein